jgi:hypothetical protein
MTLAKARVITYNCNSSFIILSTVIMIVNYDCKTFIVQAIVHILHKLDHRKGSNMIKYGTSNN